MSYDRYLDPPDDLPEGDCPVCGLETDNGEEDSDGERLTWTWKPCDICAASCSDCGSPNSLKCEPGPQCQDCYDNPLTDEERE